MIIATGVRKKEVNDSWEAFMAQVDKIDDIAYAGVEAWLSEIYPYFIFIIKEVKK